jgi:hypothetical protein
MLQLEVTGIKIGRECVGVYLTKPIVFMAW